MTPLSHLYALKHLTYNRNTLQADLKRDLYKYGL